MFRLLTFCLAELRTLAGSTHVPKWPRTNEMLKMQNSLMSGPLPPTLEASYNTRERLPIPSWKRSRLGGNVWRCLVNQYVCLFQSLAWRDLLFFTEKELYRVPPGLCPGD